MSDTREILLFNMVRRLIIRLSLSSTSAYYEEVLGCIPYIEQVYSVRVVSGSKMLVYLSTNVASCDSSMWTLERHDVSRIWVWNKLENTILLNPPDYVLQSFWKDTYYWIVNSSSDVSSQRDQSDRVPVMWSLNLYTKIWQLHGRLNVTGIDVHHDRKWHLSKSTHLKRNVWLIVSDRYTTLITSSDQIQQMRHPIPPRYNFTLVTINSSSALLFGGINSTGNASNDLWEFSLTHRMWKKVEHEVSVPAPRYGHAAAVTEFDMFVFAGLNGSHYCNQELWRFDLSDNSWSMVVERKKYSSSVVVKYCQVAMIAQAKTLWITAKLYSETRVDWSDNVWMFNLDIQEWTVIAETPSSVLVTISIMSSLAFWQGNLVRFARTGTARGGLVYMKVGCPRGSASSDIFRLPCHFCKIGFYANVGSTKCSKCPNGTTTKSERSSTVTDCNFCVTGYCYRGRCLVVRNTITQVPVCTCTIGFTGSHCQDATYYYIGMGVILVIGIITLLVIILWRTRKQRKKRETAFRRHIQTLNDAWQIRWQEIEQQDEIGGGASGRVWKAQYRNMDVAVKMLIADEDSQSSLEFAQEIKFMQTMRHPNIVLFIGAGTTSAQTQPFLVLEFAHRGSLRHVLGDVSIEIKQNRKIAFALDASKGMEFLHQLDPPRIHRDVKSENLLVSQSWIVKVADFGLGKSLRSRREHRQADRYMPLIDNDSPSDSMYKMKADLMEDGIGTVRWRAPELSRRKTYDGSIDVYRYSKTCIPLIYLLILLYLANNNCIFSFGIVLWEIWSRGFPFEEHRFGYQVENAVERGERPVIPDDCPDVYATIMKACWAENARDRPSFSEVVNCLENMNLDDAC